MEFKPKNREWVKNAAIVFLAVLLVLTFFSNTIMNRTLPEVATAAVQDGSIVAKVRGTGTVKANGSHDVKASQTREISAVMVKVGQEVQTGDTLFVLGSGDSEELQAAKDTLKELQYSYQKQAISIPTFNYTSQYRALSDAETAMNSAKSTMDKAKELYDKMVAEYGNEELQTQVDDAFKEMQQAQENMWAAENEFDTRYNQAYENALAAQRAVDDAYAEDSLATESEKEQLKAELNAANSTLSSMNKDTDPLVVAARSLYDSSKTKYDTLAKQQENVSYQLIPYKEAYDSATQEYNKAKAAYDDAYSELYYVQESNEKTLASASIDLQQLAEKIKDQQDKVKQLSGESGDEITANVNGTVTAISVSAGDTVTKDTVLCTIEVPDMGYTLSFSVTNDQAQRLRVGDTATVSNYYWGKEIVATLSTIATDPKNPQTNKTLTFDLDGDVSSGTELTISVGQKSANYDTIVPNSSIRSDSNGQFVLAIQAKSSPLGNRYIAKRVSVEVLASDDDNSAVTADLGWGDYVITTSSSPVNAGDQVRMAESG